MLRLIRVRISFEFGGSILKFRISFNSCLKSVYFCFGIIFLFIQYPGSYQQGGYSTYFIFGSSFGCFQQRPYSVESDDRECRSSQWYGKTGTCQKGGKEVLIKSTLSNILMYFISGLDKVTERLERLQCNFLWDTQEGTIKHHLVNEEVVTSPKEQGGLYVKYLNLFNSTSGLGDGRISQFD